MLWLLSTLITFSTLRIVSAQSDASCLPFYDWTFNSKKESPCEVASSLLSVCTGSPFPVDALPDASHYLGPSLQTANPCQCNTVVYSLMSACGACQGQTYELWSVWSANCPKVSIDVYPEPIPAGVSVPGWAYLDFQATDNFDQTNAMNNANLTESTSIPAPTSTSVKPQTSSVKVSVSLTTAKTTSTQVSSTAAPSVTSSPAASTTSSSSSSSLTPSDKQVNTVGGSVVGGIAGLALIFGLLYYWLHRRKQIAKRGQQLPSPAASQSEAWQGNGQGPYMAQVTGAQNPGFPSSLNSNTYSSVSGSAQSVPMNHSHV